MSIYKFKIIHNQLFTKIKNKTFKIINKVNRIKSTIKESFSKLYNKIFNQKSKKIKHKIPNKIIPNHILAKISFNNY